jgi:ABC-type dipeptide/oligopeptide/nickel transport system permease component
VPASAHALAALTVPGPPHPRFGGPAGQDSPRGGANPRPVRTYVLKSALMKLPVVVGVMLLVFFSLHLAPGDPAELLVPPDVSGAAAVRAVENIRHQLGLDKPLPVQFWIYVDRLLHGNLGQSLSNDLPIGPQIAARAPVTAELAFGAFVLALALSIPIGVMAARRRGRAADGAVMLLALFGVSMPDFWVGSMLILLLAVHLHWLPPSGFDGHLGTLKGWENYAMPVLTLTVGSLALLSRLVRAAMLDVIHEDYVRTARAKGLAERVVIYRHALRNSLLPVVTVLGFRFAYLLSGAVVVEQVFSIPGMGRFILERINARDFPAVQSTTLVLALFIVLANYLTDLAYAWIDPRVRYR